MPEYVELLTTREAAARLRCSERKLERYREAGGGPTYVKFGQTIRYPADRLAQWLEANVRNSTSEPTAPARRKGRTTPDKSALQPAI